MDQELDETISAALDGEPVDLGQLREALGTTEGREVLAGFLLIRAGAVSGGREPTETLKANLRRAVRRPWFMAGPLVPASMAASFAAVAVGGALWLGVSMHTVPAEPPSAQQAVTRAESAPAPESAASPATPPAVEQQSPPAKPTRMLRFEGWREGS
jgi:hypothetical protein